MTPDEEQRHREGRAAAANHSLPTAENVIAFTRKVAGGTCASCPGPMCGHDAVLSLVLGYRNEPRCHRCLGTALGEDVGRLALRVCHYVKRRDCYAAGFRWADQDEGFPIDEPIRPRPCMAIGRVSAAAPPEGPLSEGSLPEVFEEAASYDAGGMGCGDLVLELRLRMRAMQPGEVLRVTATDPGAPTDLPAWCQLTRHPLRAMNHPDYWIERRSD